MRVLITGLNGFVGRHLQDALLTYLPDVEILPPIADITDEAAVGAAIHTHRPDACVHLAAISAIGVARQDPHHAWRVNLGGTLTLAKALQKYTPNSRLIFASTAEAYGTSFQSGTTLDETAALAPTNIYAATKAAADLALGAMAQDGLRIIRLRPFNHTGPGQSAGFVVSAFARQVIRIERNLQPPVITVGNLDAMRDFLDVRDVCIAYVKALAPTNTTGAIYNLCSGQTRTIRSILDGLLTLSGVTARIEIDPARLRPSDTPAARGNANAARKAFGWEPTLPWETTLRDILNDWRARLQQDPDA